MRARIEQSLQMPTIDRLKEVHDTNRLSERHTAVRISAVVFASFFRNIAF